MICSCSAFVEELEEFSTKIAILGNCSPLLGYILEVAQHARRTDATSTAFEPRALLKCIATSCPAFGNGKQHDAHEFFYKLTNLLRVEMSNAIAGKSKEEKQRLAMQAPLHSHVQKRITCTECSASHKISEMFSDFSLDLPDTFECDVLTLLKTYFQEEQVEVKCEKCRAAIGIMAKTFPAPPKLLVLHLKRFLPNSYGSYSKIHSEVSIPDEFDLKQLGQGVIASIGKELRYKLQAIVNHEGYTPYSGHYNAHACDASGQWHLYDDSMVKKVANDIKDEHGRSAYLLVYRCLNI